LGKEGAETGYTNSRNHFEALHTKKHAEGKEKWAKGAAAVEREWRGRRCYSMAALSEKKMGGESL